MLQMMRHLAQSWIFKGLMLILVVSFAIWGVGDIFRGNPLQRTVAKAGHVSISVEALNHEFEQAMAHARQMFGPDMTAQQARQAGILDNALNDIIERAEVDQDIKRLGLNVGSQAVLDQLAASPQLRNKDGSFNKDLFRQILAQQRMDEQTFIQTMQQDLARRQLANALMSNHTVPQTIVNDVYKARGQKRILDVVTIKNDSITGIPQPDDKSLHAFYDQNQKLFTAPEYRGLTVVKLATSDIADETKISDDDLKKAYDDDTEQLAHPEERDIVQVVLQDEGKAKKLAAAAQSSGNLTAAAKSTGLQAVPLGGTTEATLPPELSKPVFALAANAVSAPIKSSLGWHVVQVKKVTPGGKPPFKDVKEKLRADLKRDRAIDAATQMVNKMDDDLAAGYALEDMADAMRLRLIKIPELDATGKMPDGKDPAELPYKDEVLKTAFSQEAGETSPILDDKKGNYYVVRTDNVVPSAVQPYEKVKDKVASGWKADQQQKRAEDEAAKIAAAMRDGKPASAFASSTAQVRTSQPISIMGGRDPDLPQTLLPDIFKLKKGEVTAVPLPDRQLVLRLAQIQDVDPAADQAGIIKITSELKGRLPEELTEEYLKYLHVIFPVEINHDVLETVRRQGS